MFILQKDRVLKVITTERVHRQLQGRSMPRFYGLDLVESVTNHDHEDILDTVEIYSCDASRIFEE